MPYRLYIDESGDHNYSESENPKSRYLCLTGIIINRDNADLLRNKIRELQDMIGDDPEDTRFHGEDIKSGKGVFGILHTNIEIQERWNTLLFSIINDLEFKVCGIVVDKKSHQETYGMAALHPYHYCLNLLTERYLRFLESSNSTGDVMAESRGKKEDRLLSDAFSGFYTIGNQFYSTERIQNSITSREIKIKTKSHGISGLILADIIALAVKFDILNEYGKTQTPVRDNFIKQLSEKIQSKYLCSEQGKLKGYGKKLV